MYGLKGPEDAQAWGLSEDHLLADVHGLLGLLDDLALLCLLATRRHRLKRELADFRELLLTPALRDVGACLATCSFLATQLALLMGGAKPADSPHTRNTHAWLRHRSGGREGREGREVKGGKEKSHERMSVRVS